MKIICAQQLIVSDFDEILDVRAPIEFHEDHIPGAIGLPVLDDTERELVGTIYKQQSVFEARKIGAAFVSTNIAHHLRTHLADKPGGYRPLLYCWRGGQRSNAFAMVLQQVGWPVSLLQGGYKSYRKRVLQDLERIPLQFSFRVLSGLTGTGKTEILHELQQRGEQILDLEGLANHQGSLLGEPSTGQDVTQKKFESRLWHALSNMTPDRPVWTEAESAKIGKVFCPKALLKMLRTSPRLEIVVPLADRVSYLNARYQYWQQNPAELMDKLKWLNRRHGNDEIDQWSSLVRAGQWDEFVGRILQVHYDPAYLSSQTHAIVPTHSIQTNDLLGEGCKHAADALLRQTS